MSSFRCESDGRILVIFLTDAKILDELVIRQVQDDLIRVLENTRESKVILDFRFVKFLSSSALGMLIRVHKRCEDFKISLRLRNIHEEIAKVFKITGLDKILTIHGGRSDGPPEDDGGFAKLKRPPSGGMAARDFDIEEE